MRRTGNGASGGDDRRHGPATERRLIACAHAQLSLVGTYCLGHVDTTPLRDRAGVLLDVDVELGPPCTGTDRLLGRECGGVQTPCAAPIAPERSIRQVRRKP